MIRSLYAVALFVSAVLLFLIQPMIAKMILPLLGGTPSVWNTCMVFFQAALLAGYAYAHFIRTHLSVRRQVLLHAVVLLAPFWVVPATARASASMRSIAKAAEACADSGNVDKGIEVALDVEELIYEVNTFLNAASMINRLGKT